MNTDLFKKLKIKPGDSVCVLYAPEDYPNAEESGFTGCDGGSADFVHLFVESRSDFESRFPEAVAVLHEDGLFWLSYPKSDRKKKYDINRDSLWDLVIPHGLHPVAQVSLDDKWSAIRLKKNEEGEKYARPGGGN